ncbi:hypothetical protein DH2020_041070 [Rehmannia glutinosa]|uniref:Cytochrome P450 n=1 Tax=Rehmannia glutinosa TaxID=99300 RepID=A0ABR0UR77_REHGL
MEVASLQTILLFMSFISFYVYIFLLRRKPNKIATHGFKSYPLVGTLPDFLLNRHRFLDWTTAILSRCPTNTAVFRRPGKIHGVITANPQIVEHMLKSNFDNFPKGVRFRTLLEDFLGEGIFNSDGDLWKIQRKTASYEFNTKSLRNFVMENVAFELKTRLIPILENSARNDTVLDFQDILERFAFDNICKVAFNVDPGCLGGDGTVGGEFMRAFEDAANLSSGRFMYALPSSFIIKKFLNLGSEKKLRKSIAKVHEFADKIIRTRMEERTGRDTTSSALSWFFWLLSSKPEVELKILQELENIRLQNGKTIGDTYSFDELREMHYLQASITEAMRLYPPVPIDTKACNKDDILPDGTFIGKNWFISYLTFAMGRMESVWGKIVVSISLRGGLKMGFGNKKARLTASVLERFGMDVVMEKGKCPEYLLSLTLRMKGGLPVKVKERIV